MSVTDALLKIIEDESWQGAFTDYLRRQLISIAEWYLFACEHQGMDLEVETRRMLQMLRAAKIE